MRSAHHQLGVVDDVEAEYGRASRPIADTGVARTRYSLKIRGLNNEVGTALGSLRSLN